MKQFLESLVSELQLNPSTRTSLGTSKMGVVQKVVIRQNFVVVLAGLGIQAGRCFQVVIVWVRVAVNRGLIFI